jgi:phosphoribosyl-AMP cyclohydrolase / phosphoribosyl-ATP pyrophosphohydrolase
MSSTESYLSPAIPVEQIRYNDQGLVPAIVQDYLDGTVLMMAWMNQESLTKTLTTGETWFWSRSRQQFWHKGESSGHLQKVRSLRYDCDSDALVILLVIQESVAVSIKLQGKKLHLLPIPYLRYLR